MSKKEPPNLNPFDALNRQFIDGYCAGLNECLAIIDRTHGADLIYANVVALYWDKQEERKQYE